jgi:hypothetical protein
MCRGGVGSILMMFDVLDCYILYMCLLLFVYCIPILEAPRPGGQTKQDFFQKNPYVRRFPDEHIVYLFWLGLPRGSYVHWGTNEHKANVAPGWLRDYMVYVHRPEGTNERKDLRFVGSTWPMNVR